MARKKSREQRKRDKAKLRATAKRVGDFEARILQELENLEEGLFGRRWSSELINDAKRKMNRIESLYYHLGAFPDRREAFTGLLCATGMVQLDIDPKGPAFRHFNCIFHINGGMQVTITNMKAER